MHTISARLRRSAALAILLVATNQPASSFGFEKPSSTTEQIQLATAVLSLPLSIAAQNHPDSQALAGLEHAVKAVNGFVAYSNTNPFYNGPWFLYDTYKTVACLVALTTGSSDTNQDEPYNEDITQGEAEIIVDGQPAGDTPTAADAPTQNAGERHIKRVAGTLLASIEGVLRILVALRNNHGESAVEKSYFAWCNALLSSSYSLTRVANNCLPSNNKYQSYALTLLCAHLIATYITYRGYLEAAQPFEAEQQQKRIFAEREAAIRANEEAVLNRLHALPAQHKPTLGTDDVATVFEAFWISKKNENYLIEANSFPDDIDTFCQQNHLPPIFTRPEGRDNLVVNDDIKDLFDTRFMPWFRQWARHNQQGIYAIPMPVESVKIPLRNYDAQRFHHFLGDWYTQAHGPIPGFSSQAIPTSGQSTPQAPAQPTQPNQLSEAECLRILGLPTTATLPDIERRFRQLGLTEHPDKKGPEEHDAATQNWQRISDARRILREVYHTNESTKLPASTVTQEPQSQTLQEPQSQMLTDVD